jgi:hypothetical protein
MLRSQCIFLLVHTTLIQDGGWRSFADNLVAQNFSGEFCGVRIYLHPLGFAGCHRLRQSSGSFAAATWRCTCITCVFLPWVLSLFPPPHMISE